LVQDEQSNVVIMLWMLNSQNQCGFLVPAPMLYLEKMTQVSKSFAVTGFHISGGCYICRCTIIFVYISEE